MGVFAQTFRRPYAPPPESLENAGNSSNLTFLGTGDPNLVRVAGGPAADDGIQIAQQRPNASPARPAPPQPPAPSPEEMMAQPGRGYGQLPHSVVEKGMDADEKRTNRAAAFLELARSH
jgi:hypothetical protein